MVFISLTPNHPTPKLGKVPECLAMDLLIFLSQIQVTIGLLLVALLTIIFYYVWKFSITRRTKSNKNRFKPEVEGAWPIVGHLTQLVGPRPLFRILGDMADKYGQIFMVRFGMYPTLVVSSWEMVKECFTVNDRFLASRPASAAGKYLTYEFAMIGFSFYGPYWRDIRKIATLELLSNYRLELLKHVPFTEIDNFMKGLYKIWRENQIEKKQVGIDVPVMVKVNMSQLFGDLTVNTIFRLVVGTRLFDDYKDKDELKQDQEGRKLRKTMDEFLKLSGVSAASDSLPFIAWLDVDRQKRNMKKIAKELDLTAEKWLQEHRQKRLTSNDGKAGSSNDFMDVLLSLLDEKPHFFNFSRETVVKATSLALILAASDTTSASLTWALTLLVTNQKALEKAQEELDIKVGRKRQVEERDIENLVYLQAIVKETLRMYPVNPLAVPHEATQECNVAGYHVAAGTRLIVNLWKLHHDPRVWPNPFEFKPERFLSDGNEGGGSGLAAKVNYNGQSFEYIPFGSGRRMCPAVNFAIQTLHMTLARLLHEFELQLPLSRDGYPVVVDMKEGSGLTMPKVIPLEILLTPRLPLPLYMS